MENPTLQALLDDDPDLLTLPRVVDELLALIDNPDSSFEDIAERISQDGALTARVLRIVNSAYFALATHIESVHQAIHLMGLTSLRDLVVATKVAEKFDNISGELVNVESFWDNSLYAAGVARDIYQLLGLKKINIFAATLLHHVGIMVMLEKLPQQMKGILQEVRDGNYDLQEREREVLGFSHSDVGAELLAAWGLPSSFVEVTRYHHRFYEAPDFATEAAIVHLADTMAQQAKPMVHFEGIELEPDLAVFSYVDLKQESLSGLVEHASAYLAQQGRMLA
jgi:HD-like signal output (HDOD) protein